MLQQQQGRSHFLPVGNLISKNKAKGTSLDPQGLLATLQGSEEGDILWGEVAAVSFPRCSLTYFTTLPPSSASRRRGQRDHTQQAPHPGLP